MERCPNCRARWESAENCRRCGMDLAPLLACERAAESLMTRALAALAAGQVTDAIGYLTRAQGLVADPLIGHLKAFAESLSLRPLGSGYPTLGPQRPWHGPG
jgi:hypothetical protein